MITPALISYIEQSLKSGKSKDKIKSELMLAGGWQESEINAAFATLQTSPYKKSFGSKVGSFFLTIFIVIIVIGGLAFAAAKFLGPTASQIGNNIVAALPWKQTPPVAPAAIPEPIVQTAPETQSAAVPAVMVGGVSDTTSTASSQTTISNTPSNPTPVKCASNDSGCLLQAVTDSCSPTSTTIVTKVARADLPNLPSNLKTETSTRLYTILGTKNNACIMKFTVKADTNSKFAYKSASCGLSANDLATLLNNWTSGDYYTGTGVDLYGNCTGTYFNN